MKSFLSKGLLISLALLLVAPAAFASDPVGRLRATVMDSDGAALPGVQVVAMNEGTGLERTAFTNAAGEVNFPQLPVGPYKLTAQLEGFQTYETNAQVRLGQTANYEVDMQIGALSETLVVTDTAPLVDTTSTTSGISVSTDELTERVPIVREATAVALLAPATTSGDNAFGGAPGQSLAAIGGSSVAENTYIVNGMNITNFRNGLGSNSVPFEMVQEIQVKTGGYPAEFGWATGGVVNVVTKSGTNEFHGGVNVYHEPESLQSQSPDTPSGNRNSLEDSESTSANFFLGGPIYKDRAFFFGMYEYRDDVRTNVFNDDFTEFVQDDPFYGGKLDLNVTANQRLEVTYFTDRNDETFSQGTDGSFVGDGGGFDNNGGDNYTGRYTGIFGDNFVLAAQYGKNEYARTAQSTTDANPVLIDSRAGGLVFLGNWVSFTVTSADDERDMYRLDADYFLNRHSLRAGGSQEENYSFNEQAYSGGTYFRYYLAGEGQFGLAEGTPIARERVFENGGEFDTVNEAYYVQDNWEVTDTFQVNAGLRLEQFNNKNAAGESFIEITDQYGPRVGAIYDVDGDGRSKIYANVGRYFLPIAANTNIRLSGAEFFTEDWFLLNGVNADGTPNLGANVESRIFSTGEIPNVLETRSTEIDPFYQDEFVLGYERLLSNNWSVGIRGVHRTIGEIIEDITVNQAVAAQLGLTLDDLGFLGNHYVLVNPGKDISIFWDILDADGTLSGGDGVLDRFDLTAEQLGYPEAERDYYAAEFTFNRRFADNWSLQGSYTWSHSYGNYEGWVRSDNGQDDAGITTLYDFPGLLDGANGNLPNDRRHNVKLFGAYRFDMGLMLGANATWRSGRPLNSFGIHPTDEGAASYGAESFYTNGVLVPRGSVGETDEFSRLDLTARYDFDLGPTDLSLRFDVFNVFDNDTAVELRETAEEESGIADPLYLTPTSFQSARAVRLGLAVTF